MRRRAEELAAARRIYCTDGRVKGGEVMTIEWRDELGAALEEARDRRRPVLLDFMKDQ